MKNNSQKLSKALHDLSTTRDELSTTREELSTTRDQLSTTGNELKLTINRLNRFEEEQKNVVALPTKEIYPKQPPQTQQPQVVLQKEPTQTTTVLQPLPQPPQPEQQQAEDDNPISIMTQLLQPNQPNTTPQTYTLNLQRLFNLIQFGEIQHINENDCFFKINFPKTRRRLWIEHHNRILRSPFAIFNNDAIALINDGSCYHLHLSIKTYDKENSQCFLIDTTKSGSNRLLEYGLVNVIDDWKHYQNDKGEVLFYFKKK